MSAYRNSVDINIPVKEDGKNFLRIAFGTCYGIWDYESNIFEKIADEKPDVWIWLGDVAYVDNPKTFVGMPAEYVSERLRQTKEDAPGYSRMRESSHVIGVWDDHDFGTDNGSKDFKFKD